MRRFDDYSFDPSTFELSQAGQKLDLQRQPGRVLDLLTRKPGTLVTRETLRHELWAPGTHVDFDRCINFYVRQLRRALDDDATSPRFVETLPGLGYRFVADIEDNEAAMRRSTSSSDDSLQPGTRSSRRLIAAAVLGLACGGLLGDLLAGSPLDRAVAAAMHDALGIEAKSCVVYRWKRGHGTG